MDALLARDGAAETRLDALLAAKEYDAMVPSLETLGQAAWGWAELWQQRSHFWALPEAVVASSPGICVALALLGVLGGDRAAAQRYVDRLRRMQAEQSQVSSSDGGLEGYLCALEAVFPSRGGGSALGALKRLVNLIHTGGGAGGLVLSTTANRPSVINGGRDYTAYGRFLPRAQGLLRDFAQTLFGAQGAGVVACAVAEALYQRDQTYDALVLLMEAIPCMERQGDASLLLAARALELQLLAAGGQLPSAQTHLEALRLRLLALEGGHLLPSLAALEARWAMYEGDYGRVLRWLEAAPDERGAFCTLDRFAYFVKLRVYLLQGRHPALVGLAERLRPVLEDFGCRMERCELELLVALSYDDQGERTRAIRLLEGALKEAERFRYDRLLGDEGMRLYVLLRAYGAARGETPYLSHVTELCRRTALHYPNYLKRRSADRPNLTESELAVLGLMAAERTNGGIAQSMHVSVNTVKFHSKNIYLKLGVESRHQAVRVAKELGIL